MLTTFFSFAVRWHTLSLNGLALIRCRRPLGVIGLVLSACTISVAWGRTEDLEIINAVTLAAYTTSLASHTLHMRRVWLARLLPLCLSMLQLVMIVGHSHVPILFNFSERGLDTRLSWTVTVLQYC